MKEFTTAASAEAVMENPVDIEFSINGTVFTATPPTSGQLTLFMASQADAAETANIAKAMLELMLAILGEEEYLVFENGLKTGEIEMEMVMDIIQYLVEEWSTRPTPSASDSSPRRAATGKPSTAKRRTKASTRST